MKFRGLPKFILGNRFFKRDLSESEDQAPLVETNPDDANLISSEAFTHDGITYHFPILDLDMEAVLIKSSTANHSHLYINHPVTAENYGRLLRVLVDCGIVQEGILEKQFKVNGATFARLPDIKKIVNEASSGGFSVTPKRIHTNWGLEKSTPESTSENIVIGPTSFSIPEDYFKNATPKLLDAIEEVMKAMREINNAAKTAAEKIEGIVAQSLLPKIKVIPPSDSTFGQWVYEATLDESVVFPAKILFVSIDPLSEEEVYTKVDALIKAEKKANPLKVVEGDQITGVISDHEISGTDSELASDPDLW